ncbi:hypothetical protein ACF0H5_005451 [Mactra antiquata]
MRLLILLIIPVVLAQFYPRRRFYRPYLTRGLSYDRDFDVEMDSEEEMDSRESEEDEEDGERRSGISGFFSRIAGSLRRTIFGRSRRRRFRLRRRFREEDELERELLRSRFRRRRRGRSGYLSRLINYCRYCKVFG